MTHPSVHVTQVVKQVSPSQARLYWVSRRRVLSFSAELWIPSDSLILAHQKMRSVIFPHDFFFTRESQLQLVWLRKLRLKEYPVILGHPIYTSRRIVVRLDVCIPTGVIV